MSPIGHVLLAVLVGTAITMATECNYRLTLPDGSDISCGNPVLESRVNHLQERLLDADNKILSVSSEFNKQFLGVFERSNNMSHAFNAINNDVRQLQQMIQNLEELRHELDAIKSIRDSESLTLNHLNQKVIFIQKQLQNTSSNTKPQLTDDDVEKLRLQDTLIANLTRENAALSERLAAQETMTADIGKRLQATETAAQSLPGIKSDVTSVKQKLDFIQNLVMASYQHNLQRIQNLTSTVEKLLPNQN